MIIHDDHFRDECGIFGAFGVENAATPTYMGLYALQHRGQESTGICTSDGTHHYLHKAMGLVNDVFTAEQLDALPGHIAVGHNRYSTSGDSSLRNSQPILVSYHGGHLAVAHNGNIVNAIELRRAMEAEGNIFQTTSDSEIVLHLLARSRAASFEAALGEALGKLRGAFSLLVMTDRALYAVRDPLGFRPLSLGRLKDGWCAASETCAFDINEAEFLREVEPGEIVRIDEEGLSTVARLAPPPGTDRKKAMCIFELIYFAARQPRLRPDGGQGAPPARPAAGPGAPGRRGYRHRRARLVQFGRTRLRGGLGAAL